ncbi:MAG: MFS transporter [Eubacteriales bacterium]
MKKSLGYNHTIIASYIGYITQAIVNNLAPLLFVIFHDTFDLPLSQITLLITINFLIQLVVDLLSTKFVDRIGYRICIIAAHIFASAGLISMAILPFVLPPFAGLLLAVFLYAIGGGLIEVLISPIVEACPTDNKASVMSLLHSFYCWGTVAVVLLSTLYLSVFGKDNWRLLSVFWAIVPLANAVFFTRVPIARLTEEGEGMKMSELLKNGTFWLFVVLMVSSGASEQSMSQWASAFAESGLGVSKAVGDLAGVCMFSILMGIARVFYAKMSEKINLLSFIIMSSSLCIVSYIIASLSPSPFVSLIGCALCGLSVGIMWPGVFSIAASGFPKGGTAMFAMLALAGDLGCSGGPTLVGFVSGLMDDNLKSGVIVGVVFPIILLICAIIYKRKKAVKK